MKETKIKRQVSSFALLLASVSAILGSGWLFSAYFAASIAGPDAVFSWIIGGAFIMLIAFVFAELAAMIPISGSSVRVPQYTHGTLVSFMFSWLIWLAWMSLVPTEVQAVIQYISYYLPSLIHTDTSLTHLGYITATFLMLIISIVNIYSLRWLIRCNSFLTLVKIIIPLLISATILWHSNFHLQHFFTKPPTKHQPAEHPHRLHLIFSAIASGGILFTFNGFKQACEMAGEAKNPGKSLPLAILGSVLICLFIYLCLQISFIAAIASHHLQQHGWQHLMLTHASPFAGIMHQLSLSHLMPLLYVGAVIGPLAAAFLNMLSASRSLYGKSKNGYLPKSLQYLNQSGHPTYAIIICFLCGMLLFAPLPGWHQMITFLTSIMAITYAIAPVCVLSLRKQIPELTRPFKLPYAAVWATLCFYLCNLMAYWSGWQVISKLGIALLLGFIILLLCRIKQKAELRQDFCWRAAIWLWPYFIGLSLISYAGSYGTGHHWLPSGWDFILLALLSVSIMWLAVKCTLPAAGTREWILHLQQTKELQKKSQ